MLEIEKKLVKNFNEIMKNDLLEKQNLLSKQEIKSLENNYILEKDLVIEEDLYLASNKKLHIQQGVNIYFKNDVIIFSEGSIFFNGTKR